MATVLTDKRADARESFSALVERCGPAMYRLAFRLTGNEQDAKDVVQESFIRAYRSLDQFQGLADPGTWLHRIVVNCSIDLMRTIRSRPDRRRPEPLGSVAEVIPSTAASPERLAASGELRDRIAAALEQLTPMERTAFTLRHFEHHGIDDIARTLGIRGNAAKQHVFRAVRKLRAALDIERSAT